MVFSSIYDLWHFDFSVLAALCGSLVNKAEDTAKAILPVTYLSLGGYMLGLILGASDPNNIVIRITSYIPFYLPILCRFAWQMRQSVWVEH